MSAHTANSEFAFRLPTLSYIDAKWEEPELRQATRATDTGHKAGLFAWLAARVKALRSWYRDNQAATELATMTDRELLDIGLSRADVGRVFDPELNEDLRRRGSFA
jgi:uncharacterized protein YjiS (DUF1127 family)